MSLYTYEAEALFYAIRFARVPFSYIVDEITERHGKLSESDYAVVILRGEEIRSRLQEQYAKDKAEKAFKRFDNTQGEYL